MTRHPLILLAFLPLAACGGLAGTYVCEGMDGVATIELTGDGNLLAEPSLHGVPAGTYKIDGNRLITDVGGRSNVFDIKDGNLVLGDGQCTKQ
jgi:hypothetical protein